MKLTALDKFEYIRLEARHAIRISLDMKASREVKSDHMRRVRAAIAIRDDYEKLARAENPDWQPEWAAIERHYDGKVTS